MLSSKHLATFILGAAAGVAISKYMSLNDEEKEKLMGDLKQKANNFKDEAESAAQKAKEYFEELRAKGTDALKDHMGDAEKMMNDLFGKKTQTSS
jgi:ElaB/YqjD/DUF883 family membrane-anchored ribosome-binding protein